MNNGLSRGSALLAILVLALIPAIAQTPRSADGIERVAIQSQSIEAFDPREPSRRRFGALTFRGGLILESPYRDFGGLSALRVMADGEHFLSLSDRGTWLRGRIVYRDKAPIAIADAEMAPMLGPDGRTLKSRGWYDTESLADDGDALYVGIERVEKIVRFDYGRDGLLARGRPIPVPADFKTFTVNKSLECLAVPPKGAPLAGTLIVVTEHSLDSAGNHRSFLLKGKSVDRFTLKRSDDFDISDCAVTPDGRLLVLERSFSWARGVAMRIRSVPLAELKPGALVDGPELIAADMGYQVDNMEGLSVHRDASGALVLTLVSDDNFSPLQRTLLLQFTLAGE